MYQAKSDVKKFSLYWGGGGGVPPEKVAENELKHILVLEFLRSNDLWGGGGGGGPSVRYRQPNQPNVQTDRRHSDQISRSARRDGATNKTGLEI